MKVVVIGGVAAGMSAASKLKRSIKDAQICVYEKGSDLSYGACGLPYFVGGEISDRNKLIIRTKDKFEASGIEVFDQHEVLSVDTDEKMLLVKNIKTGEVFNDEYDSLVVTTGASPVIPNWPGVDLENVHVLSTLEEGEQLKEKVTNSNVEKVVIVGAGFIGIELAESIKALGKEVVVIEFQNQILTHFDKEMAESLEDKLREKGIELKTSEGVEEILGTKSVSAVKTNKSNYDADLVILSIGVKPNTNIFEEGSIDKLKNGAIKVNKKMETSVQDVYAAGDCASVYHYLKETDEAYIPLATNANKQGKLVGSIIAGEEVEFLGALGTSMIKVFDMEAAKTGLSEAEAKEMGIDYITKTITSHNHAIYYPNPKDIKMKIVVDAKSHVLLGVQIVGYEGAALRINTAAIAIHARMKAEEIGWVDFGYAPPFSPTWDALQIACNLIK